MTAREEKLKKLESELASTGKARTEDPETLLAKTRLEQLEKENKDLSDRITTLDVTRHPKFEAYFKDRTEAQIKLAQRIAGTELAEDIAKALRIPDTDDFRAYKESVLEGVMSNLTPIQQGRIAAIQNALADIEQERSNEIQKAESHRSTLLAQQEAEKKAMTEGAEKVFTNVLRDLQDEKTGMAIFRPRPDDQEWNTAVQRRVDSAKALLMGNGLKPDDIVRAAFNATAMPDILEFYRADMTEAEDKISKLEAQVKELTKAQPAAGQANAGEDPNAGRAAINPNMRPSDATAAFIDSMRKSWPGAMQE